MEIQHPVICLCLVFLCSAWAQVDPRGSRPIEHGYKADTCATEKNWPFCSDDDWGPKCPSGCRLQGLVDKADNQLQKKVQKIRDLLATNNANHRSADHASKQTYDYLKERLTSDAGSDNSYYDLAERLRQRIVDMKIKIDRQLGILQALKSRVKDQVVEMQRLEVDIDIKLRSCKGSCKGYAEFSVDKDSYVALDKQMDQLEAQSIQSVTTVSSMSVMKSRVLKDVVVDSRFKAANPDAKEVVFFSDVKTLALTLEAEGSSASSAATVSKGPGTTLHRGDGGGGVVGGGDHFMGGGGGGGGGGGTGHTTTVSCTKTVKKITVHTKDGPQERYEEVVTGGPGCGSGAGTGTGTGMGGDGLKGFFSSSSSSKSLSSTGGTKGSSISDLGSDPFGFDLGGFMRGNTDDDVPDFHARSVKSVRTERQADYVGKDCIDIRQKHLTGEQSGLFKIRPGGAGSAEVVEVYCDQGGLLGGWLLVQQREDGGVGFNRSWADYQRGFGGVNAQGRGEVWLGNKHLHLLTRQESMMRVELEDWAGGVASAEYTVRVGSEREGYPLHVSAYTGDAGDALVKGAASSLGSFLSHAGMKFSTYDRDNDRWEENCAEMYGGGWWYNNCQSANLNGVYYRGGQYDAGSVAPYEIENGIVWLTYKPADYSLKTVRMKIRPLAMM